MKRLILLAAASLLLLSAIVGALCGWPAYQNYKQSRGVRQARLFLAKGDLANASLSARQVLQANPANLEACRILAELAEALHSPAALDWFRRLAELSPTPGNKLKLTACALRIEHSPYPVAAQTLRELEPVAREIPAFQVMSAELGLKLGRLEEAAAHFREAACLEPVNDLHRLNLAVLELQSTNAAQAARVRLEELASHTNLGPLALRWRVVDHLRRGDRSEAELLSRRLVALPRAALEDRLRHLEILRLSSADLGKTAEFTSGLRAVQSEASTNVVALYSVCQWMSSHGQVEEALSWFTDLDPKIRKLQPAPLALANLYLAKEDWPALERFLNKEQWTDLEFLRLALLARAAWGQKHDLTGKSLWDSAVRDAAARLGPSTLLLGLANDWGRDPEDLLWKIGRRFPREQWALLELERCYAIGGNTRGLNRVFGARLETRIGVGDATNQNNFATTSLLLGVNLARAHEIARELYARQAGDPIIATTYAYSLHVQGRTAEGLKVLDGLSPQSLESPPIALYYGVLLSAAGQAERACPYLHRAETANLLPEEKQLLVHAAKAWKFNAETQRRGGAEK